MAVLAGLALGAWWYLRVPEPTILSFRIGQPFEEVVANSTYPVMERSHIETWGSGGTYVTEPAVILRFDDPKHGFTLPPTKFAMLTYSRNVVGTMATSPMLDTMPFDDAVAVLENLQNQFQAGGWVPWEVDESTWFDFTPEGKRRLYQRMFEPGYAESNELRIPRKYGMTFRIKCTEGCATREPPYRFLVDVGVGHDTHAWSDDDQRAAKQAKSGAGSVR
jgi:hypothetical protein